MDPHSVYLVPSKARRRCRLRWINQDRRRFGDKPRFEILSGLLLMLPAVLQNTQALSLSVQTMARPTFVWFADLQRVWMVSRLLGVALE